jgi:23S rRNA (uracil1939-C5)-methyltransferase
MPSCPHFPVCGGCTLLDIPYDQQLASKERTIERLLPDVVKRQARWGAHPLFLPVPDNAGRFRQKVAFVFAMSRSGLFMGHYERGTQRVVPVQSCLVHSDRGNRIAFALRDHLARAGVAAAGPALDGIVRHLLVRTTADDREAVAMLVVTRNDRALRKPIRAFLESPERPDGFFLNLHDRPGPFMVGDETLRIDGRSHVREQINGVSYQISPTAFFQTNVRAAAVMQDYVVRSAAGAARVLDLYCGSGLFSLPLAAAGACVTGVEENRQAIRDAEANAKLNRIPAGRVSFVASRVEDYVRRRSLGGWPRRPRNRADAELGAVILDPPRQGCSPSVLDAVFARSAPPRVTYVSCNPQALASELPVILQRGYHAESVRAVDMFPHTEHIELIAQFDR